MDLSLFLPKDLDVWSIPLSLKIFKAFPRPKRGRLSYEYAKDYLPLPTKASSNCFISSSS
jgi:hypothetical protein